MMKVSIVALFLACIASAHCFEFIFCEDGVNVTEAISKPTDHIQVWFLEAPVFKAAFGNLFKLLKGFHTAVGFVNTATGEEWTFEYDAVYEVLNATLPFVKKVIDGNSSKPHQELEWFNQGNNCVSKGIKWSYYNAGQNLVTNITGLQFNEFIKWVPKDNVTWTEYQLFYAYEHFDGWNTPQLVTASTCYDYNWRVWDELYRLGAKFNYSIALKHDWVNVYTSAVPLKTVDMTQPPIKKEVIEFYNAWVNSLHVPWVDFLMALEDILLGSKYLHAYGKYYILDPMNAPYMNRYYSYAPFPGTPKDILEKHTREDKKTRTAYSWADMVESNLAARKVYLKEQEMKKKK
mmetsp:Transcript_121792/g.171357  ORF Transcript_121792/g.171357 Transcript_121792/m.171357 type:complete len:347 (+) Transcript_121792:69-1109(+)